METQISKPEDFQDKGFFHKHALLSALLFMLMFAGVVLAIYLVLPDSAKCATFSVECAQAPAGAEQNNSGQNNGTQNMCIEGTKPEDCNDTVETETSGPDASAASDSELNELDEDLNTLEFGEDLTEADVGF